MSDTIYDLTNATCKICKKESPIETITICAYCGKHPVCWECGEEEPIIKKPFLRSHFIFKCNECLEVK